jgi:hypothetical protein
MPAVFAHFVYRALCFGLSLLSKMFFGWMVYGRIADTHARSTHPQTMQFALFENRNRACLLLMDGESIL